VPRFKYPYSYWLWPYASSEEYDADGRDLQERRKNYIPASVEFTYTTNAPTMFNWNYVDNLICGYNTAFHPMLRSWKINFAIIPGLVRGHDGADRPRTKCTAEEAEEMVRAFEKFKDLVLKRKPFTSTSQTLDVEVMSLPSPKDVANATATATASQSPNVRSPPSHSPAASRIRRDASEGWPSETLELQDERHELEQLVSEMRTSNTLAIKDRTLLFRTYRRCFVAKEAVDWVLRSASHRLQTYSREEATNLCARMLNAGFIVHVKERSPFKDDGQLFRFIEDKETLDIRRESLRLRKRMTSHMKKPLEPKKLDMDALHAALLREQMQQVPSATEDTSPPAVTTTTTAALLPPAPQTSEPEAALNATQMPVDSFEAALSKSKEDYLKRKLNMKSARLVLDDNSAGSRYQWLQLHVCALVGSS
jgi:hypothetical protein